MLPGHPSSGGNVNVPMPPTAQNATPESAQHQMVQLSDHDILLGSPRPRSQSSNFEIIQKMNSLLGNALNLSSLIQDNQMAEIQTQGGFGDNELSTPNRAVGSGVARAIRGSGGNPIRSADPSDLTPNKLLPPQHQQLSDHLKAILARQSQGGDFGSLISPLPFPISSTNTSMASTTPVAYHWPPFSVYQSPDISSYLGGLNRLDYCTLRDPMTWAPLPIAPPQSSSFRTPVQPPRNISPERSASTGSSSSGMSMSHLTDLMAQLNTTETPQGTISSLPYQQQIQSQQSGNDTARSEWSSIYQLRHGCRPQPPLPMNSLVSNSSPPPPLATSSSTSPTNQNEYAALLLAAANYMTSSANGSPSNINSNMGISQCDPRFGPSMENVDPNGQEQQYSIERAARIYRKAATICDATCTWSGQLPATLISKTLQNQSYSCKVFVGGVPWDVTEAALLAAFSSFGPVRVEWPGKEARYAKSPVKPSAKGKGYVYMIYESDRSVKLLLENCVRDFAHSGEYYYQLTSRRLRTKEIRQVQIIPWNIGDSNHIRFASQRLDPKKTVFVGALHGMITAEVLCNVLNDLFGGVVYAGIDTDKYKYPIGSGRVTFNNTRSYQRAIAAAFVEIKSAKFSKKVQIDPYLEDATCSNCMSAPGPYFCREFMCFRYFCKSCWHNQHALDVMVSHKPLMRNTRRNQQSQSVSPSFPAPFPINNGPQF